jgi:hypothetical protein
MGDGALTQILNGLIGGVGGGGGGEAPCRRRRSWR